MITIQKTEVAGGPHADLPVLINEDCLPSAMLDADGATPAANGGGGVRFSVDAIGDSRLPIEVISFVTDNDPANGTAEIWVKVPSISSADDVVIYVWWGGGGAQPAEGDEYGSEQVWDPNYASVYHLEDATIKDSTANDNDGTDVGTTQGTGIAGKSRTFDGNTDRLDIGLGSFGSGDGAILIWARPAQNTDDEVDHKRVIGRESAGANRGDVALSYKENTNKLEWSVGDSGVARFARSPATNFLAGTWYQFVGVWDASEVALYIDGVKQAETDSGVFVTSHAGTFSIAQLGSLLLIANESWNGDLDEVRLRQTRPSDNWITTEYNNQNDPGTFATPGSVDVIGDTTVAWSGDDANVAAAKLKADVYDISWDAVSNMSVYIEYEISLNKDGAGYVTAALLPSTFTNWVTPNLAVGSYVVRVRARHLLGGLTWTEAGSGSTDAFDLTSAFTWPVTLPQTVSQARYVEGMVSIVERSEMDSGPAKVRRRHTAGVERFSSTMQLTTAQVVTLEEFFEVSVD